MYSTSTTILILLPGLPQSSGAAGYTNIVNRIDKHIVRADNLINSKIAYRYNISGFNTSGSVPPLIQSLSEDIASYYTYRSEFSSDGQNENAWTDKFDQAIAMLDEIRGGTMDLIDSTGSLIAVLASSTVDLISSNTEDYTPFFGEDTVTSWKVDSDKLSSLSDSR